MRTRSRDQTSCGCVEKSQGAIYDRPMEEMQNVQRGIMTPNNVLSPPTPSTCRQSKNDEHTRPIAMLYKFVNHCLKSSPHLDNRPTRIIYNRSFAPLAPLMSHRLTFISPSLLPLRPQLDLVCRLPLVAQCRLWLK
jgi:hypothetical protein